MLSTKSTSAFFSKEIPAFYCFRSFSYRILVSVFSVIVGFSIIPVEAKATLCSDTYGKDYGMSCQFIGNCASGAYEKGEIKKAWDAKKVGGYNITFNGVQAEDFYLTNTYKINGPIVETVLEICPQKELGGLPQEQVCCKSKGAGAPPPPKPVDTQYAWCFTGTPFFKYCLEYPGAENFTETEITAQGKHAALQCDTYTVDKTLDCQKPNCWDYTRVYVCSKKDGSTSCSIKEKCDSCEPPVSLVPECGKDDPASIAACKKVCELKPGCAGKCVKPVAAETTKPRGFMYDEETEAARQAQKGKLEGMAKSTFHLIGDRTPAQVFGGFIKALMGIIGSIALGMFVYGGFMIMSAGGNAENIGKGTQIVVWSALGVVVIFASYTLVQFVLGII